MGVLQTLTVSGHARPTVKDMAAAVELLKQYGAPEDRPVRAVTTSGGDWSLEVQWDPAADPDAKEREAPWPVIPQPVQRDTRGVRKIKDQPPA